MLISFFKKIFQVKKNVEQEVIPVTSNETFIEVKVLKFFIYNEKGDWNEKMNSDLFPLLDKDIEIFHWDSFQKKRSELEELNKTQYKGLLWSPHGGYPKLFFIAGTDYRGKSFKSDFDKLFKKGNIEEFARIINKNARDVTSTFLL